MKLFKQRRIKSNKSMNELYKTFRLLLRQNVFGDTLKWIEERTPMEVSTLYFMAICDASNDLQEAKDFVIQYHGGITKFYRIWDHL